MFITTSVNRPVSAEVMNSIRQQGIEPEIINCTFDEKKVSKPQRIVLSEIKFKEAALQCTDDFIVYQQSDILHLKTNNLSAMQTFLTNNLNFGAIALARCNIETELIYNGAHPIISGCTMFTKKGLKTVEFEDINNKIKLPSAYIISSSIDKAGLKYGYVDKTMRIKHIG